MVHKPVLKGTVDLMSSDPPGKDLQRYLPKLCLIKHQLNINANNFEN